MKNGVVGDRLRRPRSGLSARQRSGHGRRSHRRPMETSSGTPVFTFPNFLFGSREKGGRYQRFLENQTEFHYAADSPENLCPFVNYLNVNDQDAVIEISEHGIVVIVEETSCLQAKVYLQREVLSDFQLQ